MFAVFQEPADMVNSFAFQATNVVLPANTIRIPARRARQLEQIWRLHCLFSPKFKTLSGVDMIVRLLVEHTLIRTEL